jgi:DNA helicase IV
VSDDPLLLAERNHLRQSLVCLEQMRQAAERIADYGVDALASEGLGRLRADRLKQLADSSGPPFFGRTDRDPDGQHPAGEVFHIGRRHIRDDSGDPMVIDWRAPIARPFYRASTADRQGVRLRRRFGFADGQLTSFEDEHLDAGEELGLASQLLRSEI